MKLIAHYSIVVVFTRDFDCINDFLDTIIVHRNTNAQIVIFYILYFNINSESSCPSHISFFKT